MIWTRDYTVSIFSWKCTDEMILIKGLPFVFLVFVKRITFSITCTQEQQNQFLHLQDTIKRYSHNASKLDACGRFCTLTESHSGSDNSNNLAISIVVDDELFQFTIQINKKTDVNITCGINITGCCNNDSSSSLESTTQHTSKQNVTPTSDFTNGPTGESTITAILTTPTTTFGETKSISTTESKDRISHPSVVCDCSSTGSIAVAALLGLFIGVLTTGSISFVLYKRWGLSKNGGHSLSTSFNEVNETQATIRPTAGETYNEIENEPQSPKISYVLPITADQPKSSIATNNPEIYHHLREDYDVKDRNNYYDHALPLNGSQDTESDHYGKLATGENGAYSTVTNSTITEPEIVRNEAYSTIETNEFQLVDFEANDKECHNIANYFVLAKE